METGQSSGGAGEHHELPWAKLVSLDTDYPDIEIMSDEMVICSQITCDSPSKHDWCKVTKNPDLSTATVQNTSSNTILIDGNVLEKEMTKIIKCGAEIVSGSVKQGHLSYRFDLMPASDECNRKLKISLDSEHAKCSICLNIWHDVVSVAPCLHNFCNGCFSEWLKRSLQKFPTVQCPQCRGVVHFVGRNHFLRNIEEGILESDPSLRRSNEEFAVLDKCASIKSNLVIARGKGVGRKRSYSPVNEETESAVLPCPQCGTEFGGFKCSRTTSHLQCHSCGGMMPSRTNISAPQHCLGCDRAFCGAYWRELGVISSSTHTICNHENFKPISERTISRIPPITHQNNRHEQDITERCIRQTGRTLQDVISEWIVKLNNKEIDRSRMPLNHADMITSGTNLCNDCYDKLVSYLLYWFRVSAPSCQLLPEVSKRENCWYGYSCRTQHHSEEHARKRNHVCRPTRGSQMP